MLFKAARSNAQEESPPMKIVCYFDSLLTERVGFKFKNRQYVINNVDVENYMQITVAYNHLIEMVGNRSEGHALPEDDVYQKYFDLVHPLVPDFSYEDLKKLPFVLLNQLVNLILRQIAGDPSLYETDKKGEKKNPLTPIPLSKLN